MTTKTDITLPPLPRHMDSVTAEEFDRRVLAWGRAAVEADRQHQVPSDIDLIAECVLTALRADDHGDLLRASDHGPLSSIKRALLSRHSIGQPAADLIRRMRNRLNVLASEDADMADQADAAALVAEADALLADQPVASAEADREKLMRAIVEAGQRAGIIRADPEAASVTECLHILECLSQPAASAEPDDMPPLDDRATYPASMIRRLIREDRARRAAPVAQEPVAWMTADGRVAHDETKRKSMSAPSREAFCIPLYAAPVAAQENPKMPPLTEAMRAVLRNEHCVYDSEDALYSALCDAAQAQPVVNQSLTTEREALTAALKALEAISEEMTVGERYTNAGQYLIDALPTVRAALAQQPSGQDREDAADMFWDADDPERFGGDNLHDTLVDLADDYGDPDFPVTVRLQCAKRLPDVQVVVTGRNDDGELVYEVIDAARAAKEQS